MDDDFLDTNTLAELARTAPGTVRYWRHVGYGPAGFKVGRRVLYRRTEVSRWLAELEATETSRTA
jgi:hypothetical protein